MKELGEHEAIGELARIFHDVRQTLRASGVGLTVRLLAGEFPRSLPFLWETLRGNVETRAFEDAADHLRAEATGAASELAPLGARPQVRLGDSQAHRLRATLVLHHYLAPKLLVLAAAARAALQGARLGAVGASGERIERGVPARMVAMELESERPPDHRTRALFRAVRRAHRGQPLGDEIRALALWPSYLHAVWDALEPLAETPRYRDDCDRLARAADGVAHSLPFSISLQPAHLARLGDRASELVDRLARQQTQLAASTLNLALCLLEWDPVDVVRASPFPAATRAPLAREAA